MVSINSSRVKFQRYKKVDFLIILKIPKETKITNRFMKPNISHFNSLCIHRSWQRNFQERICQVLSTGVHEADALWDVYYIGKTYYPASEAYKIGTLVAYMQSGTIRGQERKCKNIINLQMMINVNRVQREPCSGLGRVFALHYEVY